MVSQFSEVVAQFLLGRSRSEPCGQDRARARMVTTASGHHGPVDVVPVLWSLSNTGLPCLRQRWAAVYVGIVGQGKAELQCVRSTPPGHLRGCSSHSPANLIIIGRASQPSAVITANGRSLLADTK